MWRVDERLCLTVELADHGTGRYGLAKDSDCYALCRKIRYAINRFFYHNSKFNSHRTTHVTPITARKDTSSRLTLSLNKNITPVHACPMPFITTRPNHHVKDIVGCARLPFPFTALERRLALDSPTERRGVSVLCPCSQPVGYFSWRRAGFGLPNPPKPPDALAIGSDWDKGNAGPASHAPVAVFGEVRASSVGRETSREGGL